MTTEETLPVQIVTVKSKLPLFKGEEQANAIEVIQLEEFGYEIVAQKDLYQIGDKAVFIEPDYCLSDISIFESYIRPNGDEKKSRLGSHNRIRSVKFNLHTGNGLHKYSQGILITVDMVQTYLKVSDLDKVDLTTALGIKKWEAPDEKVGGVNGGASKPFPTGMYRTDETNINKLSDKLTFPLHLILSKKKDGSSVSIYYKNGKYGICSRNLDKPLYINKVVGRRNKTLLDYLMFWKKTDLNLYKETLNDSDFVTVGYKYLERLITYCEKHNTNLVLRGELIGQGSKGSGNKNNPDVKGLPDIHFYGVDIYNHHTEKVNEYIFDDICTKLNLTRCDVVFDRTFESIEDLQSTCDNYFATNLIEGLVARTIDSVQSMKIMNPEYDSKK
jgi:RNA ligase (TIGR02306 family)